jgi:hypothetical protein
VRLLQTVKALKDTVAQQSTTIAHEREEFIAAFAGQQRQIKALTSEVQRVSNELALTRATPRRVANTQ